MRDLGISNHSRRLKNRLLEQISDLQYYRHGIQGFIAINSKITEMLHEGIGNNIDDNRTFYQGEQVWGNCHVKELSLVDPPPGWVKDQNRKYTPVWTLDAVASEACKQLAKCKCKS